MRANSAGLELEIALSNDEIVQLRDFALEGILQFREINSDSKKQITLAIRYNPGENESIIVNHTPSNEYFGNAEQINIELQDYLYNCLMEKGECGDRFLGAGKVLIYNSEQPEN